MEPPPGAPGEPAPWGQEPFAGQEPEELDGAAAGVMDRILLESVCQQQGWARVYAWVKKLKNLKWTRTVTDSTKSQLTCGIYLLRILSDKMIRDEIADVKIIIRLQLTA
ncbi:hypothetical protein KIL84_015633 [Mauremys mutica]|uniref:Uncharacterized protein n=1 Tax=Mauremys mutica TaxID=74926 RepID=A0A9D3WR55_9SAUR|nr:hypothetical protein KIL84_015633 [Mauremys mutica]